MGTAQALAFIALGALLGAAGQAARAIVGIKKAMDDAQTAKRTDWFDPKQLGVSFIIGAVAGIVAAVAQYDPNIAVTKSVLLGFAGAGYAGADFIGGALQKWLP